MTSEIKKIKALILELEKSGYLDLKVDSDRLQILINKYLTGQNL